MKKILSIAICVCICFFAFSIGEAETQEFAKTSADFVKGIKVGWNLGNTLESCKSWGNMPDDPTPEEQETAWNNPVTTKAMIDKVASSGFNAIRIPVTWTYQVTKKSGVYSINDDWMNRVQTVVDYCVANDMYIIINMHHDDQYSVDGGWIDISASNYKFNKILDEYSQLWKLIADRFKNYNEKLIFEGLNEVCATASYDGCGSGTGKCWWGHSEDSFDRLNQLYQKFIDTVRATGGNNAKRYLMIPTYGAQWYENQLKNVTATDSAKHLIVDMHWYDTSAQLNFSNVEASYITMWKEYAEKYGYGIVLGECGFATNSSITAKNKWANNFVKPLKEKYGIPVFLWDDGGDFKILDREASPVNWDENGKYYVTFVVSAINSIKQTETETDESGNPIRQKGDINGDFLFNFKDIYIFKCYLAKMPVDPYIATETEVTTEYADMNNDGKLNAQDFLIMRQKYAGLA